MDGDPVELGIELLANLEYETIPLPEAVDRLESITSDPAITRDILDTAVKRGVIERDHGVIRPQRGAFIRFQRDVVSKEGEFSCRRCGTALKTGYFIHFDSGELGPFGSHCIRKVTGRD